MPPLPKRKTSKSRRDRRRSHHAIQAPDLVPCTNCGEMHMPHYVCPNCGFYRGREVLPKEK
jgi:large subunit ribosomal protein L32